MIRSQSNLIQFENGAWAKGLLLLVLLTLLVPGCSDDDPLYVIDDPSWTVIL